MLVLGSMALLSFIASFVLKETLGHKMEDAIEEPVLDTIVYEVLR